MAAKHHAPETNMPKAKTKTKANAGAATTKKKSVKAVQPKKMSALDAAAQVLAEGGGSMTTREMVEAMAARKLWESPAGKTPAATLYSAILRELNTKGGASRFKKTEPGKFAATASAGRARRQPVGEGPAPAAKAAKTKEARKAGRKAKEPSAAVADPIPDGTPGPESLQELFRL